MSELFIDVYLDEDVDVLIAQLLRTRGFAATTAQVAGLLGRADVEQLDYAAQHAMAVLTHNRVHFEALAEAWFREGKTHFGIIIAARHPAHEIVGRLLPILNQITADKMQNNLVYI